MDHQGPLIAALCLAACQPLPFGEVLVQVDTEVSVPQFVSRLRVDAYDGEGNWYESRDVGAPSPADWPLSFSLFVDQRLGGRVRLRLRGYPEGGVRDFRGERYQTPAPFSPPVAAKSLAQLCQAPPFLAPGKTLTMRRGAAAITDVGASGDCVAPNRAGSVAARVTLTEKATYRFEVIAATPEGNRGQPAGDTILSLRTACSDVSTQVACNDDIDLARDNYLSRLVVALDPGDYFIVTGGKTASPADLTLRYMRDDLWTAPDGGAPDGGAAPEEDPRDVLQVGETPRSEPQPNLAIDHLVDIPLQYGERRTARVLLAGDCLGAQADLRNGLTCSGAWMLGAAPEAELEAGLGTLSASSAGSWSGEQRAGCSATPRKRSTAPDGEPLFDEEVCVEGGAFTLGSRDVIGLGDIDAVPEQVAIVEPLLFDRYELTVGRYRQALRDGFRSPDDTPLAYESPLALDSESISDPALCTFSTSPLGRERMPLNCITWYAARALCQFLGGDLPTHAEWEHASIAANRTGLEPAYSWGSEAPDCCRSLYGRGIFGDDCLTRHPGSTCEPGFGMKAVDAEPWASLDVSASGLSSLTGSLSEWALDANHQYTSSCWWQRALHDVACREEESPFRSIRGGGWVIDPALVRAAINGGFPPGTGNVALGVRCVRKGRP